MSRLRVHREEAGEMTGRAEPEFVADVRSGLGATDQALHGPLHPRRVQEQPRRHAEAVLEAPIELRAGDAHLGSDLVDVQAAAVRARELGRTVDASVPGVRLRARMRARRGRNQPAQAVDQRHDERMRGTCRLGLEAGEGGPDAAQEIEDFILDTHGTVKARQRPFR